MNLYIVRFKIKGRGNKIFTWERFAPDVLTATKSVKVALGREYPSGKTGVNGYKLVSVGRRR